MPRPGASAAAHRQKKKAPKTAAARAGRGGGDDAGAPFDDYLDAAARHGNWVNGAPYSEAYVNAARWWRTLPVYATPGTTRELVTHIRDKNVTVVIAGTGSGKTVIVPKLALKVAMEKAGSRLAVAVTNPKSTITKGNAETAAQTMDVELGREVGYAFRGAPKDASSAAETRLLFTTDGNLVAQSRRDPLFSRFSAVIIDEAHERTLYIDTLLFMLRRALKKRPDLRVIVISATIDPALFTDYFSREDLAVGLTSVAGRTHAVQSVFAEADPKDGDDYMETHGVPVLRDIMTKGDKPGNILVFVPTAKDADAGCKTVEAACKAGKLPRSCSALLCNTLYSKMSEERQAVAKEEDVPAPYDRRIVFSTNIAESSITLPSLSYVVDSGLELDNVWLPQRHGSRMAKAYCSQAQMKQREGRVGRSSPGTCFHLYTRARMLAQPEFPAPSIRKLDLQDDLLTMLTVGGDGDGDGRDGSLQKACRDFAAFITPPTATQILSAVSVLVFYGMLRLYDAKKDAAKRQLHFVDLELGKAAKEDVRDDVGRIPELFGGRVTTLGRVTHEIGRRTKLGFWNALFAVFGTLFEGETERMMVLAGVLEETGGDLASLWFADPGKEAALRQLLADVAHRGRELSRVILPHAQPQTDSEHVRVLALYAVLVGGGGAENDRDAIDARLDAGPYRTLINRGALHKIVSRVKAMGREMRRFRFRAARDVIADTPLIRSVYASTRFTNFERCLVCARAYHTAVPFQRPPPPPPPPSTPKPKQDDVKKNSRGGGGGLFVTHTTLSSFTGSPEPTLSSEFRPEHVAASRRGAVLLFEKATFPAKSDAASLGVVTVFPRAAFQDLSM